MPTHNATRHNGALVTPFAAGLLDEPTARSFAAAAGVWHILAHSSASVSHTGNTSETTLATVVVPAGAMGANGILRITTLWSYTNSANNKTLRIRLGGGSGTEFFVITPTTTNSFQGIHIIRNAGAQNSQKAMVSSVTGVTTTAAASPTTGSIDTASAQDIVISGQLASGSETVTLESYMVELFYGA